MKRFLFIVLVTAQALSALPVFALAVSKQCPATRKLEQAIANKNQQLERYTLDVANPSARVPYEESLARVISEFEKFSPAYCKEAFLETVGLGDPFEGLPIEELVSSKVHEYQKDSRRAVASVVVTTLIREIEGYYQAALNQLLFAQALRKNPKATIALAKWWADKIKEANPGVIQDSDEKLVEFLSVLLTKEHADLKDSIGPQTLKKNIATAKQYVVMLRLLREAMDDRSVYTIEDLENPAKMFGGEISSDNEQLSGLFDRSWFELLRKIYRTIEDGGDEKEEFENSYVVRYLVARDFDLKVVDLPGFPWEEEIKEIMTDNMYIDDSIRLGAIEVGSNIQQRILQEAPRSIAATATAWDIKQREEWARLASQAMGFVGVATIGSTIVTGGLTGIYYLIGGVISGAGVHMAEQSLEEYLEAEPNWAERFGIIIAEGIVSAPGAYVGGKAIGAIAGKAASAVKLAPTEMRKLLNVVASGSRRSYLNRSGSMIIGRARQEDTMTRSALAVRASLSNRIKLKIKSGIESIKKLVGRGASSRLLQVDGEKILRSTTFSNLQPYVSKYSSMSGQKLTRQMVREWGLQPYREITVEGKKFIFSRVFQDEDGVKVAYLYYRNSSNYFEIVPVYTSQSATVWRLFPYRDSTISSGWRGKPAEESMITLIAELQQFLDNAVIEDSAFIAMSKATIKDPRFAFYSPVSEADHNSWLSKGHAYWSEAFREFVALTEKPTLRLFQEGEEHIMIDPRKLTVAQEFDPEPIALESWTAKTTLYDYEVQHHTFQSFSPDGRSLKYTTSSSNDGGFFIATIEDASAPISALGVRTRAVTAGPLITPSIEYKETVQKYMSDEFKKRYFGSSSSALDDFVVEEHTNRVFIQRYLDDSPLIQKLGRVVRPERYSNQGIPQRELITGALSGADVFSDLHIMGAIQTPGYDHWKSSDLVRHIRRVVNDPEYILEGKSYYLKFNSIPRAHGIRAKVQELYNKYGPSLSAWD